VTDNGRPRARAARPAAPRSGAGEADGRQVDPPRRGGKLDGPLRVGSASPVHLHASLLIKEGRLDAREIAERMGHSVEMLERRYAHEIREYRGRRIDVQAEVRAARKPAPTMYMGEFGWSSPRQDRITTEAIPG
jgi:hypothetical protein